MQVRNKKTYKRKCVGQTTALLGAFFMAFPVLKLEAESRATTIGAVASFVAGAGVLGGASQSLLARLVHVPAGDFAIGTDGRIVFMGTTAPSNIEGQRGEFRVSGLTGEAVQISCTDSAYLSNGQQKLSVSGVEMVAGEAEASVYGEGHSCGERESRGGVSHILTGKQSQDTILLGAKIQVKDFLMRSFYSSEKGGGQPVNIQVNYI